MKKDWIWAIVLAGIIALLVHPVTHSLFMYGTKTHPYMMGFMKFGILATMGELLGIRIRTGDFKKPVGFIYRVLFWGFLGIVSVLAFEIFSSGTASSVKRTLLPLWKEHIGTNRLLVAFYTSTLLNLMFGPTMMAFHRAFDTMLDLSKGKLDRLFRLNISEIFRAADWPSFTGFVLLRAIPFFWIPAHTITFMLPPEYRVLMAAFLSIALGCILAVGQKSSFKQSAA